MEKDVLFLLQVRNIVCFEFVWNVVVAIILGHLLLKDIKIFFSSKSKSKIWDKLRNQNKVFEYWAIVWW